MKYTLAVFAALGAGAGTLAAGCYTCEGDINSPEILFCALHGNPTLWTECELGEFTWCPQNC